MTNKTENSRNGSELATDKAPMGPSHTESQFLLSKRFAAYGAVQTAALVAFALAFIALLWLGIRLHDGLLTLDRSLVRNTELLAGLQVSQAREQEREVRGEAETISNLALALKTLSELNLAQHKDPKLVPSPLTLKREVPVGKQE